VSESDIENEARSYLDEMTDPAAYAHHAWAVIGRSDPQVLSENRNDAYGLDPRRRLLRSNPHADHSPGQTHGRPDCQR